MRLRSHRRNLVVWSSSAQPGPRRPARRRPRSRLIRTGALLAVIGLMRLARVARIRWRGTLGLAGGVVAAIGVTLPDGVVLLSGTLVLLFTLLLPSPPDTRFIPNAGWPRCWAEPCLPFFAAQRGPHDR
jgi:hypothetical protein